MKKLVLSIAMLLCLIINDALASNNGPKPKKAKHSNSKSSVKGTRKQLKKHMLKKVSFTGSIGSTKVISPLINSASNGNGGFDVKKSECKTKRSKQ